MPSERDWVNALQPKLTESLRSSSEPDRVVCVVAGKRLTYASEIHRYARDTHQVQAAGYETDILIYDQHLEDQWTPRVVIEFKLGSITTHDALTYSSKASSHKHVHPYLRYGFLVGDFGGPLPGRLIRHGAYFDFMMTWGSTRPSKAEWKELIDVLKDEVIASRMLQSLLSENRKRGRKKFRLLHRPLRLI